MDNLEFDNRLAQIDFEPLLLAVVSDCNLAWSRQSALGILELYQNFLFLAYKYPGEELTVPASVDRMWHHHILNTKKYFNDCHILFGEYLHHQPSLTTEEEPEQAKSKTLSLWMNHFGPPARRKLDSAYAFGGGHCVSTRAA